MTPQPDETLKFSHSEARLFRGIKLRDGAEEVICDRMVVQRVTGDEHDLIVYERDGKRIVGRITQIMVVSTATPAVPGSAIFKEHVEDVPLDDEREFLDTYDQFQRRTFLTGQK